MNESAIAEPYAAELAPSSLSTVEKLEGALKEMPQVEIPVVHRFTPGVYLREITIPAGTLIVGKRHKTEHLCVVSAGRISVWSEHEGVRLIQSPATFVSRPGAQRIGYAHENTVWSCIHATTETDLDKLEEILISKDGPIVLPPKSALAQIGDGVHTQTKCVIYKITNLRSGRVYVGSTIDFRRRWKDHKKELNGRRHGNGRLQNAWNKYGQDSFTFDVIEYVANADEVLAREQHWIDFLHPFYNILQRAGSPRGHVWTPEARLKLSVARRGRVVSAETRAKISATLKGTRHSPESYARQAEKVRGKPLSPEHRAKIGAATKGRKHTPEAIEKMRVAQRGKMTPERVANLALSRVGRVLSAEHKAKISGFHIGRKRSAETKARMSISQKARFEKLKKQEDLWHG